ncbi:Glyoxylase, beta-lactamase superfamily II [Devosia crocina]|uniref:Glyoxylase, beta-lactamase superfamily II n=1 Tax=Devosia crocina TaxID=429728 RepID=A0A1I7NND9_9HYPH|nr:MBL fold metallo-hydrolase [Devosia crocina]SFV36174.1 Glyoxylase, beta-lactamase superfamily II [Devosia crocina]
MAAQSTPTFDTDFRPVPGERVDLAPGLARITAPNTSPYTFTGTNTFLLGTQTIAILDPGPEDESHLSAIEKVRAGRPVSAILLTHTHRDHSASAARLARHYRVPLWFGGPHRLSRPLRRFEVNPIKRSCDWSLVPDRTLVDGQTIVAGDLTLSVHATPGHCANHLAFGLTDAGMLLSGDHVMGWNSTLVSVPDGAMADYFASLDKVMALPYRTYHPAHGAPIADGPRQARMLKAHRQMRNQQVLDAVRTGTKTLGALVRSVYPSQPAKIRLAARMTMMAHIEFLERRGELVVKRGLFGTRLALP